MKTGTRLPPLLIGLALLLPAAALAQSRDPGAVEAFFRDRYEEMVRDFEARRYESALRKASAILELWPGFPLAPSVRDYKVRAKDALVARDYLHGSTRLDRAACAAGERVTVTFTLRNVHSGPVVIRFGDHGASAWHARGLPAASVSFRYAEHDYLGGMRSDAWSDPIPGPEGDIRLEPGEAWEKDFVFDTGARSPLKAVRRTYDIGALLRPASVTAGLDVLHRPLRCEPARLTVFPVGYTILSSRPGEALVEALEREAGINLFLAAHFVPAGGYGEALATLRGAVDDAYDDPRMVRAVLTALRVLTGLPVPGDPRAFRRWWALHGDAARAGPRTRENASGRNPGGDEEDG